MGVAFKACYLSSVLSELLLGVGLADEDLLLNPISSSSFYESFKNKLN